MPKLIDNKILKEILESEKKYLAKIEILVNFLSDFALNPTLINLKNCLINLRVSATKIIDNIEATLAILKETAPNKYQQMARSLERLTLMDAFYTHYGLYIPQFNHLQNRLQLDTGHLTEVNNIFSAQNNGMGLISFAIEPIQRGMRYELLLKELLHSTKEDDLDERQTTIITSLYIKAHEKNTQVNSQLLPDITSDSAAGNDTGYQFGDITAGRYQFGDISKRIINTFWSKTEEKAEKSQDLDNQCHYD